jgi:hypothetical protein
MYRINVTKRAQTFADNMKRKGKRRPSSERRLMFQFVDSRISLF